MVKASGVTCSLCGLSTYHPLQGKDGSSYCCHACLEVAAILADNAQKTTVETGENLALDDLTLNLRGMWCSSCAWLIEERLKASQGVESARVSFLQQQASIAFDPSRTSPAKIKQRVRQIGYRAYLASEMPGDEEEGFFTRMLIGGVLAMHIMTSSGFIYLRELLGWAGPDSHWLVVFFQWMECFISIPLVIMLGLPIIKSGLAGILRKMPNIHTLVAIGTISALALSIRNLILQTGHVYFDTASMLLFLLTLGRWIEMQAHRAGLQAVEGLAGQIPVEATVIEDGSEKTISTGQLAPGLRLLVRPGERFPADGLVARGRGDVDESMLSGESAPALRKEGEAVYAGTQNLDGVFEVIISAVGAETRAGQIGRLLHHALWQRSPVERLADRLAALMVPLAVFLAAGTFLFWNARLGVEAGLLNALAVLLIACPCALALATPLTLWQALARAAQNGVILRSTAVVEQLARVSGIFFDKTGTLTRLPLRLMAVAVENEMEEAVLRAVASLESLSGHPLAQAVVDEAQARGIQIDAPSGFQSLPGAGVRGEVNGESIWAGSRSLVDRQGLVVSEELARTAESWQRQGWLVIYAGWARQVRGIFAVGERLRPDSAAALAELAGQGKRVAVLTGDSLAAGARWAARLGVTVEAGLSPEDKLERIQASGFPSAMVGDGINDGPALAAAGVGISLARGSLVARSAAEAILVRDDLRLVPWLFDLSTAARRRLHQNLAWAFVYNLVGLTLAVTGHLQPLVGAFAMVASSLIVTHNALRLRKFPGIEEKDGEEKDEFIAAGHLAVERNLSEQ